MKNYKNMQNKTKSMNSPKLSKIPVLLLIIILHLAVIVIPVSSYDTKLIEYDKYEIITDTKSDSRLTFYDVDNTKSITSLDYYVKDDLIAFDSYKNKDYYRTVTDTVTYYETVEVDCAGDTKGTNTTKCYSEVERTKEISKVATLEFKCSDNGKSYKIYKYDGFTSDKSLVERFGSVVGYSICNNNVIRYTVNSMSTYTVTPAELLDGLVSYWKFDETTGTTASDSHGSNDGTLSNSRIFGTDGKINKGADFTKGDDDISFGSGVGIGGANARSFGFWFNVNTIGTPLLGGWGDTTSNDASFYIMLDSGMSGYPNVLMLNVNSPTYHLATRFKPDEDTWYYVIVSYDGTTIKIYIDGVEQQLYRHDTGATITGQYTLNTNTGAMYLGKRSPNVFSERHFDGLIDEVAIYDRALSEDEIEALYFNGTGIQYPFMELAKDSEIQTKTVSNIEFDSARLNGNVTTYDFPTNISFEYRVGTTGTFTSTGLVEAVAFNTTNYNFYYDLTGLDPDTLYEFRAVGTFINGSNDTVTIYGETLNFTTDELPPIDITFVSQSPNTLTHLNIFGFLNITYNMLNVKPATTPYLNYTYTTTAGCFVYTAGICTVPSTTYLQHDYNSVTTNDYLFRLFDFTLIPATYNYDEEEMISREKSFLTRTGQNRFTKVKLTNVDPLAEIMYLEAYLDALEDDVDIIVYYCNDNYVDGDVRDNDYCEIAGVFNNVTSYHHTHGINSFHNLLPLPLFDGKINGLDVTNTSYFVFGNLDGSFRLAYINEDTDTLQESNNFGTAWTDTGFTADVHLHQFRVDDGITYKACGIGLDDELGCSAFRTSDIGVPVTDPILPIGIFTNPNDQQTYNINNLIPVIEGEEVVRYLNITWSAFSFEGYPLIYELYINNNLIYDDGNNSFMLKAIDYLGENTLRLRVIEDGVGGNFQDTTITFTLVDEDEETPPTAGIDFSWDGNVSIIPGTCPTSIHGIFYVVIFLVFAGYVANLGMKRYDKMLMVFSGLMFMFLSMYVITCFKLFGYTCFALGVYLIWHGVTKK